MLLKSLLKDYLQKKCSGNRILSILPPAFSNLHIMTIIAFRSISYTSYHCRRDKDHWDISSSL